MNLTSPVTTSEDKKHKFANTSLWPGHRIGARTHLLRRNRATVKENQTLTKISFFSLPDNMSSTTSRPGGRKARTGLISTNRRLFLNMFCFTSKKERCGYSWSTVGGHMPLDQELVDCGSWAFFSSLSFSMYLWSGSFIRPLRRHSTTDCNWFSLKTWSADAAWGEPSSTFIEITQNDWPQTNRKWFQRWHQEKKRWWNAIPASVSWRWSQMRRHPCLGKKGVIRHPLFQSGKTG